MQDVRRSHRSRRKSGFKWIVFAIVLCSAMSCVAPVLYASSDCSRWLAEYKQGILQRSAARRLRLARYRLTAMMHKPAPAHPHPLHHRMGPLESLRRFQIDCGELQEPPAPTNPAVIPPLPLEPRVTFMSLAEVPPDLPPPGQPEVSVIPPLAAVPVTPVDLPITTVAPTPTPEPGTFLLVLTGAGVAFELKRRKRRSPGDAAV